jgi:hypothetical protein
VTERTQADLELARQRARALAVLELTEADLALELAGLEPAPHPGRRAGDRPPA